MVRNCSLYSLLSDYRIKASTETYDELDAKKNQQDMTLILILLLLVFGLWVWSVVLLVRNWSQLHVWAQVLGILGILSMNPLGALFTILLVCVGKKSMVSDVYHPSGNYSFSAQQPSFSQSPSAPMFNTSPTSYHPLRTLSKQ